MGWRKRGVSIARICNVKPTLNTLTERALYKFLLERAEMTDCLCA